MKQSLFALASTLLLAGAAAAEEAEAGAPSVFEAVPEVGVRHIPSGAVCVGALEKAPLVNTWDYASRTGVPSVSCEYLSEDFTAAIYIVAFDPSETSDEFDVHWTGMIDGFAREFPGAAPVSLPSGEGPDGNRIRAAWFTLGATQRSEMLMTEAGGWVIKARAAYPISEAATDSAAVLPLAVETARQSIKAAMADAASPGGEAGAAGEAAAGTSADQDSPKPTVDGKSIAPETLGDDD